MAEQAKKKAEEDEKRKPDRERERRKREQDKEVPVQEEHARPAATRPRSSSPPPAPRQPDVTDPVNKMLSGGTVHPDDIPLEVLRGLLFVFEGRVNFKRDKKSLRRELRRYLKYDSNLTLAIDAIKKIVTST